MGRTTGDGRPTAVAGTAFRIVRHGDLASTNDTALDLARRGDAGRVWVVAERQTAGRGRRGRPWISEAGNLYASALLIDPCVPADLAQLPFVAAVAAREAVARQFAVAPGRVAIKWPNDLMIEGRKIAGILLESTRLPDGRTAVAVGIGVNCKHYPEATETPATSLLACGVQVFPERLIDDLAAAFARVSEIWDGGRGFAAVRAEWLAHAAGIGGPIRVRLMDGEETGVFEAIDEAGRLVLAKADGGRRLISAGDVFFGAPGRGGVK